MPLFKKVTLLAPTRSLLWSPTRLLVALIGPVMPATASAKVTAPEFVVPTPVLLQFGVLMAIRLPKVSKLVSPTRSPGKIVLGVEPTKLLLASTKPMVPLLLLNQVTAPLLPSQPGLRTSDIPLFRLLIPKLPMLSLGFNPTKLLPGPTMPISGSTEFGSMKVMAPALVFQAPVRR